METQFFITYEVVDPTTQKTDFVTEDRYIAEHHYEKGYTVYENHVTITRLSPFTQTRLFTVLCWNDEDTEPKKEEVYNGNRINPKPDGTVHRTNEPRLSRKV